MRLHQKVCSLVSLTLLSGCYLQRDINMATPWKWESPSEIESSHYIVQYKPGRVNLARADQVALKELYQRFSHPDRVVVQIAVNDVSNLETSAQMVQRVKSIRSFLKRQGIPKSQIKVIDKAALAKHDREEPHNNIVVVFDAYKIINPKCPGWDQVMDGHVPPEGEENFGCSNHSNLVNMVSDKRRLIEGEKLGDSDGTRSALAVHQYRTDKVKKLPIEQISQTGGVGYSGASSSSGGSGAG